MLQLLKIISIQISTVYSQVLKQCEVDSVEQHKVNDLPECSKQQKEGFKLETLD